MKTKALVIGIGYMGKKHLAAYLKNKEIEVVGLVCKSRPTYEKLYLGQNIAAFINLDEAIAKTNPDVASICTPTNTHYKLAKKCIEKGLDILIEKPLTRTIQEAKKLKELAKDKGRLVLCAHTELFNKKIELFLNTVKNNKQGRIKSINIRKLGEDVSPKHAGEKFNSSKLLLYDKLIHLNYILNCIIPEIPEKIQTKYLELGINKEKIASFMRLGNIDVNINSEYNKSYGLYKEICIELEKGRVQYVLQKGQERVLLNGKEQAEPQIRRDVFDNMVSFFLNRRNKKNTEKHKASIENAIQTMTISSGILDEKNLEKETTKKCIPTDNYVLRLSLKCNVSCIYCNVYSEEKFKEKTFDGIKKKIPKIKQPEIIITGGEPTCVEYLPKLIKLIHDAGKVSCLQTNAILCRDKDYVFKLKLVGLDRVFVSLPSHIDKKTDYLFNVKNTHKKSIQGIKNLHNAGITVNLCHVINTINYRDLPDFVDFVHKELPFVRELDLLLVQKRGRAIKKPWLVPSLTQLKPFLDKVRQKNYKYPMINNAYTLPLCYFGLNNSLDFKMNTSLAVKSSKRQQKVLEKNKIKAESCKSCKYDCFCSGVWGGYEEVHGLSELKPIFSNDKRTSSKFKNKKANTKKTQTSLVIRPSLECNQNCKFCNVKFEKPFKGKNLTQIFMELAKEMPDEITISGGEPTLLPYILKIIKFADLIGVKNIGLQTNAILCSYKKFTEKLKEAGLTEALVSLHSHRKKISDYITRVPGSWEKTIKGIKNLVDLGIRVRISHVINTKNYKHLPDFVFFIKKQIPSVAGVDLLLNQQRGMGEYHKELLPKLSDIKWYIMKAREIAKKTNIELVNAFGFPFCYWGDKSSNQEYILLSQSKNSNQINSLVRNKVKSKSCKDCEHDKFCLGIWKGYTKIYGTDELTPIKKKL